MDGVPSSVKEKQRYLSSSASGCEVARCISVWSLYSLTYMKIEVYVKDCEKAALALLFSSCFSSFSLDPNLALVRNTCLISQFFSSGDSNAD